MQDLMKLLNMSKQEVRDHLGMKDDHLFLDRKSRICLVAHVDTVDDGAKQIIQEGGIIRAKNTILGADDRAGLFALQMLGIRFQNQISILYTDLEESGARGACEFCEQEYDLSDIKLFIEIDRHGSRHYVNYNPIPEELEEYLEDVTLERQRGLFSDIAIITDYTGIPSINLACGYYHEHTSMEYLNISELNLCMKICEKIINDINYSQLIL